MNRTGTALRALGKLDDAGHANLFTGARIANTFAVRASDAGLSEIRELAKWAPTSASTQRLRGLYVRAHGWRERAC